MNDPRNSQVMRDLIDAIRATWWTFCDIREARLAERQRQNKQFARAARQLAQLRAMTDEELQAVCYPELRRRGLPVPWEAS
ncbi:hypothetical protein LBMAG41_10640 [Cyanobium sp.]|nr:hypothetical protein LBMAG41_10640 [Cyanobium sp.]